MTAGERTHSAVGTRDWVRRRGPSWILQGASAASAAVALASGAHALAAAVCWLLVVLEGGLLIATAATLWRIRRLLRERFVSETGAPGRPQRRIVRAEGLIVGLVAVLAGLDALYTYRPGAVGLALVFFGAQLLYDRRARR